VGERVAREPRVARLDDGRRRSRVAQHARELRRRQAPVERDERRAEPQAAVEQRHALGARAGEQRHAVPYPDAGRRERPRPPVRPPVEPRVRPRRVGRVVLDERRSRRVRGGPPAHGVVARREARERRRRRAVTAPPRTAARARAGALRRQGVRDHEVGGARPARVGERAVRRPTRPRVPEAAHRHEPRDRRAAGRPSLLHPPAAAARVLGAGCGRRGRGGRAERRRPLRGGRAPVPRRDHPVGVPVDHQQRHRPGAPGHRGAHDGRIAGLRRAHHPPRVGRGARRA
jgi:hypothetical protein